MHHIGRFGCANHPAIIRADGNALGFNADFDFFDGFSLAQIDNRDLAVVFIGNIKPVSCRIQGKSFRIVAGRQFPQLFQRLCIDYLDGIVIAGGDIKQFIIRTDGNASGPLTHAYRFDELSANWINHG
jgi:hypothetical protein